MFDKALYQAPVGLNELDPIEIEIEDPESVSIHAGDLEIEIGKEEEDFGANLAEGMDESELATIADDLLSDFQSDIDSRKDWDANLCRWDSTFRFED